VRPQFQVIVLPYLAWQLLLVEELETELLAVEDWQAEAAAVVADKTVQVVLEPLVKDLLEALVLQAEAAQVVVAALELSEIIPQQAALAVREALVLQIQFQVLQ